jgi:hypothetical protein
VNCGTAKSDCAIVSWPGAQVGAGSSPPLAATATPPPTTSAPPTIAIVFNPIPPAAAAPAAPTAAPPAAPPTAGVPGAPEEPAEEETTPSGSKPTGTSGAPAGPSISTEADESAPAAASRSLQAPGPASTSGWYSDVRLVPNPRSVASM